ncbi:hypothetical protein KOR42_40430 [Thalassoglobus neptunius]|uniref:Uncharacterized protein n=1 Tax=Thalassoglobus neptunius TaxID=1938619 RepID=A0A5C5WD35_9PLAN|nr:hypothetical protein KOR42_40430 [Thalassoglobus neptunius]
MTFPFLLFHHVDSPRGRKRSKSVREQIQMLDCLNLRDLQFSTGSLSKSSAHEENLTESFSQGLYDERIVVD